MSLANLLYVFYFKKETRPSRWFDPFLSFYLFYEFDLLLIFYLNEEESLIIRILFYNFFFANIIYYIYWIDC